MGFAHWFNITLFEGGCVYFVYDNKLLNTLYQIQSLTMSLELQSVPLWRAETLKPLVILLNFVAGARYFIVYWLN